MESNQLVPGDIVKISANHYAPADIRVIEVSDDATNAQIRTAFKKSLKAKTLNKKILSSFIEYVA